MAQSISMFVFFIVLLSSVMDADSFRFSRNLSPASVKLKREKLSHLHFYFHDTVNGPHPTAVRITAAPSTNKSTLGFGELVMINDPLTVGPDRNSKVVGRAQGTYGLASQTESALLMVMNFAFVDGKYNGSSLGLLGRNVVMNAVREMPIVGGSGVFRFARGYAEAKTHTFDLKTGDAIVEYYVYVFHY